MQRFASVVCLPAEHEQRYREVHSAVWPGVLRRIEASGIRNYSIFLRDGVLFSYFEYAGDDFEADMQAMADDPETQRWWDVCKPLQEPFENRSEGEWWASMEEVFHHGGPSA